MRLILGIVGVLLLGMLIALAALPWWFGPAAAYAGRTRGLTFEEYERVGYSRFALNGVVFEHRAVRVSAERMEADSPLFWLFRHWTDNSRPITATTWRVEVKPRERPPASPSAGAMALRERLLMIASQLERWLPRANVGTGAVQWSGGELEIARAAWEERTLDVEGLRFDEHPADVSVAFEDNEIALEAILPDGSGRFTANSHGRNLTGRIELWEQTATLSATFGEQGWLPASATFLAENLNVAGSRLQLGEFYSAVRGGIRLDWRDGRFATAIDLTSETVPEVDAPPLMVSLRGQGDIETLTIESLQIEIPGVTAALSEPVALDWTGSVPATASVFTLAVDLAEQPWFAARGRLTGEARLTPREAGLPLVAGSIEGRALQWRDWSIPAFDAEGRFEWPQLEMNATVSGEREGDELVGRGTWDFERKELLAGEANGTLTSGTVVRWLPDAVGFGVATVELSAQGPIAALQHTGTLHVGDLLLPGLHGLDVHLAWQGTGDAAEIHEGRADAGRSALHFTGNVEAASARLTTLRLVQDETEQLALTAPATVRWSPTLEVGPLRMTGPDRALDVFVAWGADSQVELTARNVPSSLWVDFAALPDVGWNIAAMNFRGQWSDGPLTYAADAAISVNVSPELAAEVALAARGNADGAIIDNLLVSKEASPILTLTGRLPITLHPGAERLLVIDEDGSLALTANSASSPAFWDKLRELTGFEVVEPVLAVELAGTWAEPQGEIRATAGRVAADPERVAFAVPQIEALDLRATADTREILFERLTMQVEGQALRATGRLPLGPGKWDELATDPLAFLRGAVELRIEIPDAEIAALQRYTGEFLAPEGRFQLDAAIEPGGEMTGVLHVRGASARPLGPLGVLQDITAEVGFAGRTANLRQVKATAGGRPVTLTGKVELPLDGPPDFDLVLKGSNLPLVRQTGFVLRGDLDLKLTTGDTGVPELGGVVRLRDSLFLSDIRAMLPRGGRGAARRPPYFAVEGPLSAWRLAIDVQGKRFLRLRTALFVGLASMQFRLSGTLGAPKAIGEATVDEGRVLLPFATFDVQHGSVRLTEAEPFEPGLLVAGVSRTFGYDLRMELAGTVSEPALTFTSSPPLGAEELLAMVMTGEAPRSEGAFSGSQRYARIGTYLGQSVLRNFGGDRSDANRLSVSTGGNISRLGRETYRIEYRLSDRFSLAGHYDEFDEFNTDVKWHMFSGRNEPADEKPVEAPDGPRATLDITGLGWFGNWEQRRSLKSLLGEQRGETLDANDVEDAAVLLLSAHVSKGYLQTELELELTTQDGRTLPFTFDSSLSRTLPRPLAATAVEFHVTKGVRHVVDTVHISGLTALPLKLARGYFRPDSFLFNTAALRAYTPARLSRAVDRLHEELRLLGFAEAEVTAKEVAIDEATGHVALDIEVVEGPRWEVVGLDFKGADEFLTPLEELREFADQPWSRPWQQDFREAVRRVFFERGHPDVTVELTPVAETVALGVKPVVVTVAIEPGPAVVVGEIRFEGSERTRTSVLRRRVATEAGEPLDPIVLERARYRLSRLGIFNSVEMRLEPVDGAVRDPVFLLDEGRRWDGSLLLGYGTYERLRAGVELRQLNLFGLAHQSRLELVQSMKSSRGDYSYTVPELFGESIDGTARLFGLQREETSFERRELGVNVSLRRPVERLAGDASVGYTFQSLRNRENELSTAPVDLDEITVASIDLGLTSDWRDNPLRPRRGWRWFGRLEAAARNLGGQADFQRLVMGGAYHTSWGSGRWVHVGLAHGAITTFGGKNDLLLPVNKRFFPGGDGSIRGYQDGEAAPRAEDDRFIGAKTYVQANLEFEQALSDNWSAIVFFDALGSAAQLQDYPFDEKLYSTGVGVRFHTLIGPVRLEYGHNLNPRPGDPSGTLHFSIGFPF